MDQPYHLRAKLRRSCRVFATRLIVVILPSFVAITWPLYIRRRRPMNNLSLSSGRIHRPYSRHRLLPFSYQLLLAVAIAVESVATVVYRRQER